MSNLFLRILTDPSFITLARELTWEEMDTNFIELVQLISTTGATEFPSVEPYDATKEYEIGVPPRYVTSGGNLWENVSLTPHTSVTPGTDPSVWAARSVGELTHVQNTDFRLGNQIGGFNDPPDGFEINATTQIGKNIFWLEDTVGRSGPVNLSIKTRDGALRLDYEFIVYYIDTLNPNLEYHFSNDANQIIGANPLVLKKGDWAVFRGSFSDNKTTLLYSSVSAADITARIEQVSYDVEPEILASGTFATIPEPAIGNQFGDLLFNASETYPDNLYDGKYLVLDYLNNTGIAPLPKTAHKILENTGDGFFIDPPYTYTGSNVAYQVVNQFIPDTVNENTIALLMSDNIVVEVPEITAGYDRNAFEIYREWGYDPDKSKKGFIFLADPVRGAENLELVADGEMLLLKSHLKAPKHWDKFNTNSLGVGFNVSIETPDTTPLSNATLETIKGVSWNLNHPCRFEVVVQSDGSIAFEYTSTIERTLMCAAVITAVRDSVSPDVTIAVQIDTGSGFATIDSDIISITGTVDRGRITFPFAHYFKKGHKLRFMSSVSGGNYHISRMKVVSYNSNA
jgi:hypothetical protein